MKLIFLRGAPAAGKLTTAKPPLLSVPGRLFDNHAAIDVARSLFDFGARFLGARADPARVGPVRSRPMALRCWS